MQIYIHISIGIQQYISDIYRVASIRAESAIGSVAIEGLNFGLCLPMNCSRDGQLY